jgi:methyl-accepting chemotaxis protein
MNGKSVTLRKQFLIRLLTILLVVAIISGVVQLYFISNQIITQTSQQANVLADNVLKGIEETDLATKSIEHQIDLKLIAYSKHIASLLQGKPANEISQDELIKMRDNLSLAGITIFQEMEDDVIGVVATENAEVGFSFKEFGYYEVAKSLISGEEPVIPGATFTDKDLIVLPISQSGSQTEEPLFFKYAYYHIDGTDYLINPYIKANEVYQYTEKVGPATRIEELVEANETLLEVGVLNPKVFADPSLEKQLYPPLKKVEAGTFEMQSNRDIEWLTSSTLEKESYIEKVDGKKVYKMFLSLDENRVIYLSLDYEKMSGPLYRHSIILILSGLISLVVLFLFTARFFDRIYKNIQKIKKQVHLLEERDLTAKSNVKDGSELAQLSESANHMVSTLHSTLTETNDQAEKVQKLSLLLEAEASQTVEKMYELSTETTIKSREQLLELVEFLDMIEQELHSQEQLKNNGNLLEKIAAMREVANNQTAAATDLTITLADLLEALHGQSSELSDISKTLLDQMGKFKL